MGNNDFIGKISVIGDWFYEFTSIEFHGEFIKIIGRKCSLDELKTYYLPSSRSIIKLYGDKI